MKSGNYIDVHTHSMPEHRETLAVVNFFPEDNLKLSGKPANCFYSLGLHPCFIDENHEEMLDKIRKLSQIDEVIAIGEAGLDRNAGSSMELQEKIFRKQAGISASLRLPLLIHCVKALPEIIRLKKDIKDAPPWIIHGYSGNIENAKQLINHDIMLSFGHMLRNRTCKASEVIKKVPEDMIFLETDDSLLSIFDIYDTACGLLEKDNAELKKIIEDNFKRTFFES